MEERPAHRIFATAAAVVAATFAYFSAPLLAFADAGVVAGAGSLFGVGAAGAWLALRQRWGLWWQSTYTAAALAGGLLLAYEITHTVASYGHNQERCATIQGDMLSPRPRRSDGPDLFQALGCRPQGGANVQFPARTANTTPTQLLSAPQHPSSVAASR
jgi:hypothetical protein